MNVISCALRTHVRANWNRKHTLFANERKTKANDDSNNCALCNIVDV